MKKLSKFNDLLNKIIFENVQEEEQVENTINYINTCEEFFNTFITPIAQKVNVYPIKARFNVFRLYGPKTNILNFFKNFKVDKTFAEDPKSFKIINPMISICENQHSYNKLYNTTVGSMGTEGETLNTYVDPNTIEGFNNNELIDKNIYGVWHELFNYDEVKDDKANMEIQKIATPKQTLNQLIKITKDLLDNTQLYIEFMVNTDKLANNSFEETAKAIPIDNGTLTLSDTINMRPDVIEPKPNKGTLGTKHALKKK